MTEIDGYRKNLWNYLTFKLLITLIEWKEWFFLNDGEDDNKESDINYHRRYNYDDSNDNDYSII